MNLLWSFKNVLYQFYKKAAIRILDIKYMLVRSLQQRKKQNSVEAELIRRRWAWIGHILKKQDTNVIRQALILNPQGKRKHAGKAKNHLRKGSGKLAFWGHSLYILKQWQSITEIICPSTFQSKLSIAKEPQNYNSHLIVQFSLKWWKLSRCLYK